MKILYAVQGTGQGHISRARAMAEALREWPVEVTWLFSGRPREALFDMEPFGHFAYRQGLSFTTRAGRLRYRATLRDNRLRQFVRDTRELDLRPYDLLVCDYEPVLAHAARRQGRSLVGIGHQYAFGPHTPRAGESWLQEQILARFAPVNVPMGLHWHPYADNVLPPILDLPDLPVSRGEHLLVYLPFEDQDAVTAILRTFPRRRFVQYAPGLRDEECGNVARRRADFKGFKLTLASCEGVICNSGFELISECLQWRKPVLTKPLHGQMEQHSNAMALEQLGYASVTQVFDAPALADWLADRHRTADIQFPAVAPALARWLANGCAESPAALARTLWRSAPSQRIPAPRPTSGRDLPAVAWGR
ncbi:MJ1255/VC2487 family glycosyltransferase [Haliea sp. E17]|uniref:MJ1255/VC2487 family glycosyltransferase n=1 Tax=Haliea sp. E17 TaxID=3401576 RepID=UPI003AAD10EB